MDPEKNGPTLRPRERQEEKVIRGKPNRGKANVVSRKNGLKKRIYKEFKEENSPKNAKCLKSIDMNCEKDEEIKSLKEQLKKFQKLNGLQEKRITDLKEKCKILGAIFSPAQIAVLTKKKKSVYWSPNDMLCALTIKCLNENCYLFLRNCLHYPLPGLSILNKWYEKRKSAELRKYFVLRRNSCRFLGNYPLKTVARRPSLIPPFTAKEAIHIYM